MQGVCPTEKIERLKIQYKGEKHMRQGEKNIRIIVTTELMCYRRIKPTIGMVESLLTVETLEPVNLY